MMGSLAIFVLLAAAAADTFGGIRLHDQVSAVKATLTSVVEWFGELGMFCAQVARAAVVPPYEFGELIRQCDAMQACLATDPHHLGVQDEIIRQI